MIVMLPELRSVVQLNLGEAMNLRANTSVTARLLFGLAIGAGIAFAVTSSIPRDSQVIELLNAPSVIDRFQQMNDDTKSNNQALKNPKHFPLVREAERFALLINPPSPPKPLQVAKPPKRTASVQVRPQNLSPTFKLHATIYHSSQPNKSMALVWKPGNNLQWVKQGDRVEYFTVEEIRSGSVILRNGKKLKRVTTERKQNSANFVRGVEKSGGDHEYASMTIGIAEIDTGNPIQNPETTKPAVTRQSEIAQSSTTIKATPLKKNEANAHGEL